jgi:hypothetical protein
MRKKADNPTAIVVRPRPSIWLRLFAWTVGGSKADFIAAAQLERALRVAAEAELRSVSAELAQLREVFAPLAKEHVKDRATLRLVAFGMAHGMTHQQARDRGLIPHYEDPIDTRVIA